MESVETGRSCLVCEKGIILKITNREFDPLSGPPIIGPGSRSQIVEVTSYHCKDCGVAYAFVPKKEIKPKRGLVDEAPGS